MKTMPDRQVQNVRVIVLLSVVSAILALLVLNVFYPMPIDFYAIVLWLLLGIALLYLGLQSLRGAWQRRRPVLWYQEPDVLFSLGAFVVVLVSLMGHILSGGNYLIDAALLLVFGIPTTILILYAQRLAKMPLRSRKSEFRV